MAVQILNDDTIEKLTNSSFLLTKSNYGNTVYFDDLYNYIQTLYNMNIRSYNYRYGEAEILDNISKSSKKKFNNICEVLKSLQCLKYNIDEEPQDTTESRAMEWLESQIDMIKNYLIGEIQDYKEATWG